MRRDALGTSGHVTAKSSICGWGAFCKSGVYAAKVTSLTPGDLSGALEIEAGRRAMGAEYRGGVCKGHSRSEAGKAIEALQAERRSNR